MTSEPPASDGTRAVGGRPSLASIRELYDRWAGYYDWNPVMALVRPARRRAVASMELDAGDTVVDMGTGTGANLPYLRAAVGTEGHVVGIDLSQGMLSRARRRVERRGWDNVTLIRGDVRDPPIDAPVDGILSAFVVVMYPDPGQLIDAWADCLDGGAMANLYAGPSRRWYAPAVNAPLRLYLHLFEEGWDRGGDGPSPLEVLAARGSVARGALEQRASGVDHHAAVFGLAHLDVGRLVA